MAASDQPAPVKPQGFGLETQTELPEFSPSYGATRVGAEPASRVGSGLAVHTQADGKGPLKGAGLQISGAVEGVEHKDGMTTIRYEAAGRVEAVSFPSHKPGPDGQDIPNPLMAAAEGVEAGEKFGLKIGREGNAVLTNASRGLETSIQADGRVESRAIEQAPQRTQDLGITRDAPY